MEWVLKPFYDLSTMELYKILRIRDQVFIMEQNCLYLDCDNKDLKGLHLYAQENGEITAYLRILPKNVSYEEASIGRVLVSKNYRGRGLGKELMQRAISNMVEKMGERSIRISAQSYLLRFYTELGFDRVGAEYLEDEIPHVQMLYSLKS